MTDRPPLRWKLPAFLFVLTALSVADAGAANGSTWGFALPLLAILVAHEMGHYLAARWHGVPASLPLFLPLPRLSPFGTMGAIIIMEPKWKDRRQLLDIGAAGPWAGFAIALPVLYLGLRWSPVLPQDPSVPAVFEGQSLLYWALKRAALGPIPPGHDVFLHPTALAGWAGLMVTFLNLIPVWQLDGGHVAYALWGEAHSRWVRWAPALPAALLAYNGWRYAVGFPHGAPNWPALVSSTSLWFTLLALFSWFALGRGRSLCHPAVPAAPLDGARRVWAWATMVLFLLVFMPTPWLVYEP